MAIDHHKKPFDEGTIAKLEIFEDYAQAWLPTFIMAGYSRVAIFDLFAGQGYDVNGVPGSSLRLLRTIKSQIANILDRRINIDLYLNEFKPTKFDALKDACDQFLIDNPSVAAGVDIYFSRDDFVHAFERLSEIIGTVPSLVYLDQSGIKAIGSRFFSTLETKPHTDFLYFISSSYFWRFGDSEEFRSYLDVDLDQAKMNPYTFIHRHVLERIKRILPKERKLMLYPFSIKKGANIYGIIFGASHAAAVEKFLRIAWKKNKTNGEANFDIDDDAAKNQPDLWGNKALTKLESFERDFSAAILNGEIGTNRDALNFAYSHGHLGTHAAEILRGMKSKRQIHFEGSSPLVTYEKVFREKRRLEYKILSHGSK